MGYDRHTQLEMPDDRIYRDGGEKRQFITRPARKTRR
jgi:hypothetical protein